MKFGFTTRAKNELLSDSTRKELELQLFVWDLVFEKQVLIQILIYASPLKVLWTQARPEWGPSLAAEIVDKASLNHQFIAKFVKLGQV